VRATPEELVRQLFLAELIEDYAYEPAHLRVEHGVSFGRERKRADIVVMDPLHPMSPLMIIEVKKPKLRDGKEQLRSYCNATGAPIGVWTNGQVISYYHRKDPNYFEDMTALPRAGQSLADIVATHWTYEDLAAKNKLSTERKTLKSLILEMEDEVLANAGVDVFEEIFKLIFAKLYDETEGERSPTRTLEFRNYGESDRSLKENIQRLLQKAVARWEGVFTEDVKLSLSPSHLAVCVSALEGVKLLNSNLEIVDEAFEYLVNKSSKGEKGQYFTPRYVIDMCVRMINPREHEALIDTAAGSCGFPVHSMFYVWDRILRQEGAPEGTVYGAGRRSARCEDYASEKLFAIDFDEKVVRVGRTLNLIAGDGGSNVLHLNSLDYEGWDEWAADEEWQDAYGLAWRRLRKMRLDKRSASEHKFDVVMANPPFAGDIKESRILAKYELSRNPAGKFQASVGRDTLFIERNLAFLKPGGRMAIVLPQGMFNNASAARIREFISIEARIIAVIGLHGNTFKPHTGTKTSVLIVQKWDDELCPVVDDYNIFFAVMDRPGKNNSGEKLFKRTAGGDVLEDLAGNPVVDHGLFRSVAGDGDEDGIVEAFVDFAQREGLSFA
jgi:type I restriction enzyme M protein